MMNVVEIEGVSQRYGPATVLHDLNLSLAPGGVIRVPAHRPIPGAVPPPVPSAIPAVPGLGGLSFPWMESSRRFVKERFTGG